MTTLKIASTPLRRIQLYQPRDFMAVALLWSRVFSSTFPDLSTRLTLADFSGRLQEILVDNHQVWIAVVGEEICGFTSVYQRLIRNLFVTPEHQGHGLGTHLINAIKSDNGPPLFVQTLAAHWRARTYYKKLDFQFFIEEPSEFEGFTQVVYRWDDFDFAQRTDIDTPHIRVE